MTPSSPRTGSLRIVELFGDLLGTYGDGGNAIVLERRAAWRGIDVTRVGVSASEEIPDDGDVYLIGGGEDGPQTRAARLLVTSGALDRAVDRGAAVLAVCAGFQILGHSFTGPDGARVEGLGLLDVTTTRGRGGRTVGEIVVDTDPVLGLGRLTGYENHAGITSLGKGATPLGVIVGPRDDRRFEGAHRDRIVGTYLHGPVLARNPAIADRLLAWALDTEPDDLPPLDDTSVAALRAARFDATNTGRGSVADHPGARSRLRRVLRR